MIRLDEFFGGFDESLHPLLRDWKRRLKEPCTTASIEVFRPQTEFGASLPELSVQFVENGRNLPVETIPWDDELNEGLIRLGVRAARFDDEAERFALRLRAAFRQAEREFGDGYFNSVLLALLRESDFSGQQPIAEVLQHAFALPPKHPSDRYELCRDLVKSSISGRAQELTSDLNYSRNDAEQILISALARYVDERFTVSSRRRMGLL